MGLYFDDIVVGSEHETATRIVSEADIAAFAALTGDHNPLHTDEAFARGGPYGTRIAHGPLVLALAIGLMSGTSFITGTALGQLALQWRFLAPVKIGDAITVRFTVTEKRASGTPGRGIVTRSVRVFDQHGTLVQDGVSVVLVRAR